MKTRTITAWVMTVLVIAVAMVTVAGYDTVRGPAEGAVAVRQLNGGALDAAAAATLPGLVRRVATTVAEWAVAVIWAAWLVLTFREKRMRKQMERMKAEMRNWSMVLLLVAALLTAGCLKPYDVPEFAEIKPNETAFMVAMEGDSQSNQAKFNSVEYLESVKVATKRVQIQKQIDEAFTAELKKKLAEQDRLAQAVKNMQELEMTSNTLAIQRLENEKELAKAENQRKVAETFQQAAQAQKDMTELEIRKTTAQAWLALAGKWQGGVPSWVMLGGGEAGKAASLPMLLNMPVAPPSQLATK